MIFKNIFLALVLIGMTANIVLAAEPKTEPQKSTTVPEYSAGRFYVKVGDTIFNFPSLGGVSITTKSKGRLPKSSRQNPIIAEKLGFLQNIALPGTDKEYMVQYLVTQNTEEHDRLFQIKETLLSQGKEISDLPKRDGFYEYNLNYEYVEMAHYISDNKILADAIGEPIVLSNCHIPGYSLRCSVSFKPDLNLIVRVRSTDGLVPPIETLKIWLKAYPIYLKHYHEHIISPVDGG